MKRPLLLISLLTLTAADVSQAESSYSGTYLLIQDSVSVTKMPIIADVVAKSRAISVQKLTQEGERLRGSGLICDVALSSSSSMVSMKLPQAFIRALPPVITDAVLETKGGDVRFSQRPETIVLGANLSQPQTEALPIKADDPRVTDSDGDGHPGVTVKVSGIVSGDIYLVQRNTSSLSGKKEADGFKGDLRFSNEQTVLNATSALLKDTPESTPDPKRSRFVLKRVPDGTTCKQAMALAKTH